MSMVITLPKILHDKLGPEGANALADTFIDLLSTKQNVKSPASVGNAGWKFNIKKGKVNNKLEESYKNHVLEVAESKFERRLSEEISGVRVEIAKTKAELIKWMFIFWAGQLAVQVGLFLHK